MRRLVEPANLTRPSAHVNSAELPEQGRDDLLFCRYKIAFLFDGRSPQSD